MTQNFNYGKGITQIIGYLVVCLVRHNNRMGTCCQQTDSGS